MFEPARMKDIYLDNEEKATRLENEIICLLKNEHISLSETRYLFCSIIGKLEDAPLK